MDTKFLGRLAAGCVAVSAVLIAIIVSSPLNPSRAADPAAQIADTFSPYVGKDGSISRPADYRNRFVFLGTYVDATKADKSVDQIRNVYAPLESVQAFRRDGKFPDGTVLVNEVCGVDADKLTTGQAHWVKDTMLSFVMIKDSERAISQQPSVGQWTGLGFIQSE